MKILILNYNKGGSKSITTITKGKIKTFNHLINSMPKYFWDIWLNMGGTYFDELGVVELADFKKIKEYSKQFELVLYFKYGQLLKKWRNNHYHHCRILKLSIKE